MSSSFAPRGDLRNRFKFTLAAQVRNISAKVVTVISEKLKRSPYRQLANIT